jgi:tetratricopeptide (TPR) repeat protein
VINPETGESQSRRERRSNPRACRRRRTFIWLTILILLVAAIAGAKPGYHWLKARRAEHFAAQGNALFQQGKWNEAATKYRVALLLDPLGYAGLAGAARLASRANRPEALDLWEQVARLSQYSHGDRQEYAALLLKLKRFAVAKKIIERLLATNPDLKTLDLASRYAEQMGESSKALEFTRIAINRAPNDDATRSRLAELLASSTDSTQRAEARQILWKLASKEGSYKRPALQALGRAPELSADEKKRIVEFLEGLSHPAIEDTLLAADLRLKLQPNDVEKIYDEIISRFGQSETTTRLQLALWLNSHRQSERVLKLLPPEQAAENNQLLLPRLDALANLQRWIDINNLLDRGDLTFDPSVIESFRARSAQGQNDAMEADLHWARAISLASGDPSKLRFVANFAEQSRAGAVAVRAYERLARFPEHASFAYRSIERAAGKSGELATQRAAAERVSVLAPNDPNSIAQLAYLNLLMGLDVPGNLAKADELVKKYPDRLSFRVAAALGYLRQHDSGSALAQFKGPANAPPIEWSKTPPSWRAIYAAALLANDQPEKARQIIATIPADNLNAEERVLITPVR